MILNVAPDEHVLKIFHQSVHTVAGAGNLSYYRETQGVTRVNKFHLLRVGALICWMKSWECGEMMNLEIF